MRRSRNVARRVARRTAKVARRRSRVARRTAKRSAKRRSRVARRNVRRASKKVSRRRVSRRTSKRRGGAPGEDTEEGSIEPDTRSLFKEALSAAPVQHKTTLMKNLINQIYKKEGLDQEGEIDGERAKLLNAVMIKTINAVKKGGDVEKGDIDKVVRMLYKLDRGDRFTEHDIAFLKTLN